jgi:hypothetical protein
LQFFIKKWGLLDNLVKSDIMALAMGNRMERMFILWRSPKNEPRKRGKGSNTPCNPVVRRAQSRRYRSAHARLKGVVTYMPRFRVKNAQTPWQTLHFSYQKGFATVRHCAKPLCARLF